MLGACRGARTRATQVPSTWHRKFSGKTVVGDRVCIERLDARNILLRPQSRYKAWKLDAVLARDERTARRSQALMEITVLPP